MPVTFVLTYAHMLKSYLTSLDRPWSLRLSYPLSVILSYILRLCMQVLQGNPPSTSDLAMSPLFSNVVSDPRWDQRS